MSSDNHASYARIGFVVMLGLVATAGALIYLGGFRGRDREILVETYYDNPVSGLSVGSAVNFRGVKVGEVREISFATVVYRGSTAPEDAQRIVVVLALDKRVVGDRETELVRAYFNGLVERGLRATVASSGITGLSRIELNIPDEPPPCAKLSWTPRYPLVPPAPSLLDSFSDAATKMMNRLKSANIEAVWSNVQTVACSAARLSRNADDLVESQRAGIESIVHNVEEATDTINDLARVLRDNPSLLLRSPDGAPLPETER